MEDTKKYEDKGDTCFVDATMFCCVCKEKPANPKLMVKVCDDCTVKLIKQYLAESKSNCVVCRGILTVDDLATGQGAEDEVVCEDHQAAIDTQIWIDNGGLEPHDPHPLDD